MEKPLFWHQGLFLQPQHLQLNDLCNQSNFMPYHKYIQPYLYGITRLEIKEAALSNFSLQIDSGELWFNDMTYAVINGNAVIEPRFFQDVWVDGEKPLTVYIGLKKNSSTNENVATRQPGDNLADINTRFVTNAAPEQINDLHQGGAPAQVKKMSYLLKLFFDTEKEQLGNYDLIPVAKIERQGDEVRISKEFIPPCVSINSSAELQIRVKEMYNQLTFRGRELESHKKKRGIHNAEFGSRDMVYLLALRSFNRYIPVLSHMLEGQDIHPWNLYSVIRQLIGELSSFSDRIDVLGNDDDGLQQLPVYDHNDVWHCFAGASVLVSSLLDEITAGPEYVIPLNYDESYFSAVLNPEFFDGNNHYYIVIRTDEEVKTILDTVEIEVKVGALKILPVLIERALPGAVIEYLPAPPQELPRRSDSIYYRVDNHDQQWGVVEKEKTIGLYWEDPPEDLRVEIMIVRRK